MIDIYLHIKVIPYLPFEIYNYSFYKESKSSMSTAQKQYSLGYKVIKGTKAIDLGKKCPPLCVVHGFLSSAHNWVEPATKYLSPLTSSKIILIDLPGHGESKNVLDSDVCN